MAGRADPYAPERSASELVAEYQRRYQKRRDERRTYNLAAGGMIAVLFVLAAAVVFWGTPPKHIAPPPRPGPRDIRRIAICGQMGHGRARHAASRTVRTTSR